MVEGDASGITTTDSTDSSVWTGKCCEKPCWHSSGQGFSYGWGGSDHGYCCNCGAKDIRTWHTEDRPIPGHGPHARHTAIVYNDEKGGSG